jgi:hypothetical protein
MHGVDFAHVKSRKDVEAALADTVKVCAFGSICIKCHAMSHNVYPACWINWILR